MNWTVVAIVGTCVVFMLGFLVGLAFGEWAYRADSQPFKPDDESQAPRRLSERTVR